MVLVKSILLTLGEYDMNCGTTESGVIFLVGPLIQSWSYIKEYDLIFTKILSLPRIPNPMLGLFVPPFLYTKKVK